MSLVTAGMPKLMKVWPDFAEVVGVASRPAAYAAYNTLPDHLKCRIGTRVRVDAGKLAEWIAQGGSAKSA